MKPNQILSETRQAFFFNCESDRKQRFLKSKEPISKLNQRLHKKPPPQKKKLNLRLTVLLKWGTRQHLIWTIDQTQGLVLFKTHQTPFFGC